jgi:predicted small secreted protein
MLRKTLITLAIASIALTATACNTVRGAGKDLESAANTTSDAINK